MLSLVTLSLLLAILEPAVPRTSPTSCETITLHTADSARLLEAPIRQFHSEIANNTRHPVGSSVTCWTINVRDIVPQRDETYIVKLTVKSFTVNSPSLNPTDGDGQPIAAIEIHDGQSSSDPTIARWSEKPSPGIVFSSGTFMYVVFTNSDRPTAVEVSAAVLAGSGPRAGSFAPCTPLSVESDNLTYTLLSPGYPHGYPNSIDLCWVLYLGNIHDLSDLTVYRKFIELAVQDSVLEDNAQCDYDYVHSYDGPGASAKYDQISHFCGTMTPDHPMISCRPYMYVHFHTDATISNRGWYMTFRSVPLETHPCHRMAYDYGNIFGWATLVTFTLTLICSIIYFTRRKENEYLEKMFRKHLTWQRMDEVRRRSIISGLHLEGRRRSTALFSAGDSDIDPPQPVTARAVSFILDDGKRAFEAAVLHSALQKTY